MTRPAAILLLTDLAREYNVEAPLFIEHSPLKSGINADVTRPLVKSDTGRFFRDGVRMAKSETGSVVSFSNKLWDKSEREIMAILVHEFAHVLQYSRMNNSELKSLRMTPATKEMKAVTSYHANYLEGEAELFTYNKLGYCAHGYIKNRY